MGAVKEGLRRLNATLGARTGYQIAKAPRATPAATSTSTSRTTSRTTSTPTPSAGNARGSTPQPAKADAERSPARVRYRPPSDPAVDRLLRRPIFIMSPPRSGSTLLRVILGKHSRLHSQHETHFRRLGVTHGTSFSRLAMRELDLELGDLQHLLWDRVLHWSLTKAGKDRIVEKTPSNAFAWKRISTCWPDAQYVFLLRHPASIAKSWQHKSLAKRDADEAALNALSYMQATERARNGLPGYTVRYEDLTADPETVVKDICSFLGIEFEPEMLNYGADDPDLPHAYLGDDTENIRSGRVQPARELPDPSEIPGSLVAMCRTWGYL